MMDAQEPAFLEIVLESADFTFAGRDEVGDPLPEALTAAGIGEVTGGGSGMGKSNIDVEVSDLDAGPGVGPTRAPAAEVEGLVPGKGVGVQVPLRHHTRAATARQAKLRRARQPMRLSRNPIRPAESLHGTDECIELATIPVVHAVYRQAARTLFGG
jgi:hypothetical protein